MKKIFTLITVSLSMFSAIAQPNETFRRSYNNQGRLSVSTTINDPVKLMVDGRNYNSMGNDDEIAGADIKPGYHSIKVYQQRRTRKNSDRKINRNMQLVYEGNIYVKPRYHVDVVINRFGKAFIDERQMTAGYYDDHDDHDGDWDQNNNNMQPMNSRAFEQFKQVMRNESFDNTRMLLAKHTIAANYFSTAQVKEMVGLFSFENSKLDIAKYCYKYTIDQNNYFILNDAFAYSSSKEELARFIQAYR